MPDTSTLFCFGLGYTAIELSKFLIERGWSVRGTCRSQEKCRKLTKLGIKAWVLDDKIPLLNLSEALEGTTHLLSSVPPKSMTDPVIEQYLSNILNISKNLHWAGYLSSTSVYGDKGGDLVDEKSDCLPTSIRGNDRHLAENSWRELWRQHDVPLHVFRLSGIYGPGRNALEVVKKGKANRIIKKGQVFNRIHVDDIVKVLLASINQINPGSVYNICDDLAAPPQDIILFACKLLNVAPPPEIPFNQAKISNIISSFYLENKRVSNSLIKSELGIKLSYPEYRSGLKSIFKNGVF